MLGLAAGQVIEATQRHQVLVDSCQPAAAVPLDHRGVRQRGELLHVHHEEAISDCGILT